MNRMLPTLFALAVSILMATAAASDDACEPTTSDPEVDTADLGGTGLGLPEEQFGRWYVDNDPCQPECLFSIWIYPETNGKDGLQRNDEVKDDTCGQGDGDGWVSF